MNGGWHGIPGSRRAGPVGKLQKLFEEVSTLPRRQQDRIAETVSALLEQYRRAARCWIPCMKDQEKESLRSVLPETDIPVLAQYFLQHSTICPAKEVNIDQSARAWPGAGTLPGSQRSKNRVGAPWK